MKTSLYPTYLAVISVNLLGLCTNIALTWPSPMFIKLRSTNTTINPLPEPITDLQESLLASFVYVGIIIGPFPFVLLARNWGRKISIIACLVPLGSAFCTLSFAKDIKYFYFSRVLMGLAIGGGCALLPMYTTEIADAKSRGFLSNSVNAFWNLGNLITLTVGPFVSYLVFNATMSCIPVISLMMIAMFVPETPYYWLMEGKRANAEESLMKLRNKPKEEIQGDISNFEEYAYRNRDAKFKELFKSRSTIKAVIISIILILSQLFSGIDSIFIYGQTILKLSGSSFPPEISSILIGLAFFLSSFSIIFAADRFGRKVLLIISNLGVSLCHFSLGLYFYLHKNNIIDTSVICWLPSVAVVSFTIFYNLGLSSLPWTISSELLPSNVRSVATMFVPSIGWGCTLIFMFCFTPLTHSIGIYGVYWLFSSSCLLSALFVYVVVPETRGKTLSDIQVKLERKK